MSVAIHNRKTIEWYYRYPIKLIGSLYQESLFHTKVMILHYPTVSLSKLSQNKQNKCIEKSIEKSIDKIHLL
jgi:hypothetical protein